MHRTVNWISMLATLAAAFALYAIKYDTRKLEARVHAQERALEKAESDVTILTAERAHLSRPERLEPLARLQGLEPIAPSQYVRIDGAMGSTMGSDPTHATYPRSRSEREGLTPLPGLTPPPSVPQ